MTTYTRSHTAEKPTTKSKTKARRVAKDYANPYMAGILLGVVYQIMNRVFAHLGVLNDWPPFLSAITPTVLFLAAGLVLLYMVQRR